MWYSNRMHFPFQEIYIEYAQFIARRTDSEGSIMQHQNMLSQDIRRWSSRIRKWSIEALEELEIRSEALKFSWYHARSTSRSEDKKMLCTKLFDSYIFKRCINKDHI